MKTSFLLIMALFINTTLLLAEPIAELLKSISIWPFILLEVLLFLGYYLNTTFNDLKKETKPDFNSLNIFVIKGSEKVQTDTST